MSRTMSSSVENKRLQTPRNAPANIIDPITLTAAAADMAKQLGLSAKILDEKELGFGQINFFHPFPALQKSLQ